MRSQCKHRYSRYFTLSPIIDSSLTQTAVMLLPLGILRKLRIAKTQKLGLVLVFAVSLLTIALELFRFVRNITGDETTNNVLYAVINANLTVIISCTPTYRSLWKLWQKSRPKTASATSSEEGAYARPRKSVQKLGALGSDLELMEGWEEGSLSGAGDEWEPQRLQRVARPPSYRP